MTVLLEMRERLKLIYSKGEPFILPLVKLLLAFVTFNTLNGRMGYMTQLDNVAVVLIMALMCSFLPVGALVFLATVFSLAHMYALSLEVALIGLCVYLVMYLLFFRFSRKDSLVMVLTPLLCALKIPYVVPLVVGLLCGPMSVVSVSCGVVVYYLLQSVVGNATNIKTMSDEEALAKVRLTIESIIQNRAMLVVIVAFSITVLVVYLIRRMSIDYSWTIAIIAGAMIDVMVLLVGDLLYDINISVGGALLGSLLAIAVAKIVEFFRFCVDYSRTEKVQFEDDEYYYYVKAVPKMTVPVSTKTVKKINSQQSRGMAGSARGTSSYQGDRTSQPVRAADRGATERAVQGRGMNREQTVQGRGMGSERLVQGRETVSERAAQGRGVASDRMTRERSAEQMRSGRGNQRTGSRPQSHSNVTIGSTQRQDTVENVTQNQQDDYEELF